MPIFIDESTIPDLPWAVYTDEGSGQDYFYNRETQVTQWDAPAEYTEWRKAAVERYLKSSNSVWRIGTDAKGKFFYFNKATDKSEWSAPPEVVEVDDFLRALTQRRREDFDEAEGEEGEEDGYAAEEGHEGGDASIAGPEGDMQEQSYHGESPHHIDIDDESKGEEWSQQQGATDDLQHKPAEGMFNYASISKDSLQSFLVETTSSTADDIEKLEGRLRAPDAIMERDVVATIEKYMRLTKKAPEDVIKMLSSSYVGHAKMVEMVADWLSLARGASTGTVHESVRKFVRDEVSTLCIQKFDKATVDSVVRADAAIPRWLVDMMGDPLWRRLLIQLYDANKTSAFLGQCIRHIAAMGHHEEISQYVQGADYFVVFSKVLEDLVSQLGALSEADIASRTENLKKLCVNSEYLYLYAQSYLASVQRSLEARGSRKRKVGHRMIEYVERLQEELERGCVWDYSPPGSDSAVDAGSKEQTRVFGSVLSSAPNLVNKLDGRSMFALRMTNSFAAVVSSQGPIQREICDVLRNGSMEELHLKRLAQYIFGIADRADSVALISIEISRAFGLETSIMRALTHYKFVQYVIEAFMHPKRSLRTKASVERAAALIAVISFFRLRLDGDVASEDPAALAETIGSRFQSLLNLRITCSELLTLEFAGGIAFEKKAKELVELQQISPMNSFCVLQWIHALVTDISFLESPSYVSLYTAFLQSIVTAIDSCPSQHSDCFALLQIMFHYKAKQEDESTGRSIEIVSIKRDVVECLVHLTGRGYAEAPFSLLVKEVPAADASLMRHTALLLLGAMEPPVRAGLDAGLVSFIENPNVLRSLLTKHFTEKGLSLLRALHSHLQQQQQGASSTGTSASLATRVSAVIAQCERVS